MSYSLSDLLAKYNANYAFTSTDEKDFICHVFNSSLEHNPDGKCSESFIGGLTLDEINWIIDEAEPA